MTSIGGGLRFAFSFAVHAAAASFIAALVILFAAGAHAQVSVGDATVSELAVSKSRLSFSRIDLSSNTPTQTKSFTITDSGGLALSVTVAPPTGSPFFTITSGQGTTLIQPHAAATVKVGVRAHQQGKFLGEHRNQQRCDLGRIVGQGQTVGIGKGIVGSRLQRLAQRLLRHRRPPPRQRRRQPQLSREPRLLRRLRPRLRS